MNLYTYTLPDSSAKAVKVSLEVLKDKLPTKTYEKNNRDDEHLFPREKRKEKRLTLCSKGFSVSTVVVIVDIILVRVFVCVCFTSK